MRTRALVLVAALSLGGCEHLYGGFDQGRLVEIARRAAAREHLDVDGLNSSISDDGPAWRVRFEPGDPAVLDGGVTVKIDKTSHRATSVWGDA